MAKSVVKDVVLRHPDAIGLVVIITNDYSNTRDLITLSGTQRDGQALSVAFSKLNFAVCWEKNVTSFQLANIIGDMAKLRYEWVKKYRCIIFVFAGHGKEGDNLCMQDGTRIQTNSNIVIPLLPKNAREIGNIKKAFLIDACRGENITATELVPRGSSESQSRGGSVVELARVPSEGNFLIAHSTMPKHEAYESTDKGGVWLSTVASLLKRKGDHLRSLQVLLTEANTEIAKSLQQKDSKFQQAEQFSRLNGVINLDPNSGEKPSIAAVFPGPAASSEPADPPGEYTVLLSRYARNHGMSEEYTDFPSFSKEYNHTYYTSQLTIRGRTWNSTHQFKSSKLSREEVAKMAYQSFTADTSPPSLAISGQQPASRCVGQVPTNHRARLNEFCQKRSISHRDDYIEDHSMGNPQFKCSITCLWNGKKITQDSGKYCSRKDDAREIAAHKILLKFEEQEKAIHSPGSGRSSSRGATGGVVVSPKAGGASQTPLNMIWKSKLKEYYDKLGKPGTELVYRTTEVPEGGSFVSAVFIPNLRREVEGNRAKSKKEAEQSAAKKALQLLTQTEK